MEPIIESIIKKKGKAPKSKVVHFCEKFEMLCDKAFKAGQADATKGVAPSQFIKNIPDEVKGDEFFLFLRNDMHNAYRKGYESV